MPRPISIVHVTPDFEKAFLRLPKHIQTLATRKDQWFRRDAFDPRLRTHKLKGELSAYWAYSSTESIVFCFVLLDQPRLFITMSAPMKFIAERQHALSLAPAGRVIIRGVASTGMVTDQSVSWPRRPNKDNGAVAHPIDVEVKTS
jgi:hypothetical protein